MWSNQCRALPQLAALVRSPATAKRTPLADSRAPASRTRWPVVTAGGAASSLALCPYRSCKASATTCCARSGARHMKALLRWLHRDPILSAAAAALLVLLLAQHPGPCHLAAAIDWPTLFTIAALVLLTGALDDSGLLSWAAFAIARRVGTQRSLAAALTAFTAASSAVATNDAVLLVSVPAALRLGRTAGADADKLAVLQIIAANVGSAISPIGNPQNVFLWHASSASALAFAAAMLPPAAAMAILLAALTAVLIPARPVRLSADHPCRPDIVTASAAIATIAAFIVAADLGWPVEAGLAAIVAWAPFRPRAILRANWSLVAVLAVLMLDASLLAQTSSARRLLASLASAAPLHVVISAAAASQILSNVPVAFLMAHFTTNWTALAWGVNIGGNGTAVASLANVIGLRLAHSRRAWLLYHACSAAFLAASLAACAAMLSMR